jgi:hypothetical protein
MAMRISPVPHFWAPVAFTMIGDNGQSIDVSFQGKFKRLSQKQYEHLMARVHATRTESITKAIGITAGEQPAAEGGGAEAPPKPINDHEIVEQVLIDWKDMLGDDDQPLAFTSDNLERALDVLGCRAAIVKTFFDRHNKEHEKNFALPSATTSAG